MLQVSNVCAGYGEEEILHGISFSLKEKETLCIIGPNGCGKSTLLKAIAGLLPFSGEITLSGLSLSSLTRRELALRVGLLAQHSGAYFSYSVWDTVMLGRYPHQRGGLLGHPNKADAGVVERCLAAVELLTEKDRDIGQLSGGQLQRVFLARTLAQEPRIILLDEPTNHLDLKYQVELVRYLRQWSAQTGCGVIGVLHDINLALQMADRLILLEHGSITAQGTPSQLVSSPRLKSAYGMDVADYMRRSFSRWKN